MAYKNKEDKKQYQKEWRLRNKEYRKQYRINNKERIKEYMKEYMKEWRLKNKENMKQYHKQYQLENKEKLKKYKKQWQIDNREYYNQYHNKRYKTNLKYNLNIRMSRAIRESLKGNKAGRHWENLVGYSVNDLEEHLQKKMPPHYNWQDYLEGKLHLDHIIPISAHNFDNSNQIDFLNCWALKNLQLLPAEENISKNDKLYKPFQPALKIAI